MEPSFRTVRSPISGERIVFVRSFGALLFLLSKPGTCPLDCSSRHPIKTGIRVAHGASLSETIMGAWA